MKNTFKIITGTDAELEKQLNDLNNDKFVKIINCFKDTPTSSKVFILVGDKFDKTPKSS